MKKNNFDCCIFLDFDGVLNRNLFYEEQQAHFFQTDSYSGLTPNTVYKIKRFLTHKTF